MKKTHLALLFAGLSVLAACDYVRDPTMRPDYTTRVVPTATGSVAIPPTCPSWSTDIKDPYDNQPDPMFGCATARNLAAMAENPDDLVEGRALSNARGVTQVGAIKRYDNNQPRGLIWTGSETNTPAATTASTAASSMTGDTSGGSPSSPSSSPAAAAAP